MIITRCIAGKVLAMRDISVQESELLPIILQPLISSALQAAAGKPQPEAQAPSSAAQSSSSSAGRGDRVEAIRKAAPAVEKLRVRNCSDGISDAGRIVWLALQRGRRVTCQNPACANAMLNALHGRMQA